jgi:hypothetical protein
VRYCKTFFSDAGVSCLHFLMDPELMLAFSDGLEPLAAADAIEKSDGTGGTGSDVDGSLEGSGIPSVLVGASKGLSITSSNRFCKGTTTQGKMNPPSPGRVSNA